VTVSGSGVENGRALRKARPDWWFYPAAGTVLLQAAAALIPHARPGWPGVVLWWFGLDLIPLVGGLVLLIGLGWSAFRRPFWRRPRVIAYLALLVVIASPTFAFRVYPSSYDRKPSQVRFRLPLDGPVTVAWGGATPDVNYHVFAPEQRWAYDLLITRDGKSYQGDGKRLEDYYYYGVPVLAPADGVVRSVRDGEREWPPGQVSGKEPAGGNEVVIEVAPREFLFLAHLKPGTIQVKPGDRVRAGQEIARGGNSGNTSEPHLHIHLQDSPDAADVAEGIPLYFHDYLVDDQLIERGVPTGGLKNPQTVEHAGD
jgi:murein DD-endopeptidase MepM/ murein hydrolase activator NlpD